MELLPPGPASDARLASAEPAVLVQPRRPQPFWGDRSLLYKLLWLVLPIVLTAVGATAVATYRRAEAAYRSAAFERLEGLNTTLAGDIERFFRAVRVATASRADEGQTREALTAFSLARASLLEELSRAGVSIDDAFWAKVTHESRRYLRATLLKGLALSTGDRLPAGGADRWLPRDQAGLLLFYVYAVANPAAPGQKAANNLPEEIVDFSALDEKLRGAFARTAYARAVAKYQPALRLAAQRSGYEDILLADPDGTVVYSLLKGQDFQGNLRTGPVGFQNLPAVTPADAAVPRSLAGHAFVSAWYGSANPADDPDERVVIPDFAPYEPLGNQPSAFAATAMTDAVGRKSGVLLARLSTAALDVLVRFNYREDAVGLGRTGYAFVVGSDGWMRTQFRFPPEAGAALRPVVGANGEPVRSTVGQYKSAAEPVTAIFRPGDPNGNRGTLSALDQTGASALIAYRPLAINGLEWGVVCGQSRAEALAPADALLRFVLILGAILLPLIVAGLWLAGRALTRPILSLASAAGAQAGGDTEALAPVLSNDEVGRAAAQFNSQVVARNAAAARLRQEYETLERDILTVREVLSQAAKGDLSVRLKVGEGPLESVAAAFNIMRRNLAKLLATFVLNARLARAEASAVRAAAGEGGDSVTQLLEGATQLQDDVRTSANQVKDLGEGLGKIGEVLELTSTTSQAVSRAATNLSLLNPNDPELKPKLDTITRQFRSLAEQTLLRVKTIHAATERLREDIEHSQAEVNTHVARADSQNQAVQAADAAFRRILERSASLDDVAAQLEESAAPFRLPERVPAAGAQIPRTPPLSRQPATAALANA